MELVAPWKEIPDADTLSGKIYRKLAESVDITTTPRMATLLCYLAAWVDIQYHLSIDKPIKYLPMHAQSVVVYIKHPDRIREIQVALRSLGKLGVNTSTQREGVTPETLLDAWQGHRFGILDLSVLDDDDFTKVIRKAARMSANMFNGFLPQIFIAHVTQPKIDQFSEYIKELRL